MGDNQSFEADNIRLKCQRYRSLILQLIEVFLSSPDAEERSLCLGYIEELISRHLEAIERLHRLTLRFYIPGARKMLQRDIEDQVFYNQDQAAEEG